jgi:hypothetical protein
MIYDNVSDFLAALKLRMSQFKSDEEITSATDITCSFNPDELEKIDSIKDEAIALFPNKDDAKAYIYRRLSDLGYSDDDITQIFDYEGI